MSVSASEVPVPPSGTGGFRLDLGAEARRFVRRRLRFTSVGLVLGTAFVAIGGYEILAMATSQLTPNTFVAGLVLVLGVTLIVLGLRSGLLNPAVALREDGNGLRFERRWGAPIVLAWTDPAFELEIEDLAPDTASSPEEKRHLFFSAPGPVYGTLALSGMGPLLDVARANGLEVQMRTDEVRTGRVRHRIRQIRITPSTTR